MWGTLLVFIDLNSETENGFCVRLQLITCHFVSTSVLCVVVYAVWRRKSRHTIETTLAQDVGKRGGHRW